MDAGSSINNLDIDALNQHKRERGTGGTSGQKPAEKRLGRGLADVSYLFMSSGAVPERAGGAERADPAVLFQPAAADHLIPMVADPSLAPNRGQFASLLNRNASVLEAGMRAIDTDLACEIGGPIGLLAIDSSNRLVIIDFEAELNDSMLMSAISHFDWLVRNIALLKRMYGGHAIDFASRPRVFLVAPRFSEVLRRAAGRIVYPQITCFRYQSGSTPEGVGVLFERV